MRNQFDKDRVGYSRVLPLEDDALFQTAMNQPRWKRCGEECSRPGENSIRDCAVLVMVALPPDLRDENR